MGVRLFVPEVVQTSAMDCGPACLKSLLEGFGIDVSYDRLREACQTDLDGTSIDTVEQLAVELGLDAEQIMVPADHLLLPEAQLLPALIVVRLPNSLNHFVIVWRSVAGYVQVMDPAQGRRWMRTQSFLDQVLVHAQRVDATQWRDWAGSNDFLRALRCRGQGIGLCEPTVDRFIADALDDPTWRSIARLDAAIRMLVPFAAPRQRQRCGIVEDILRRLLNDSEQNAFTLIPPAYWSVLPVKRESAENQLVFRGTVLLRVRGKAAAAAESVMSKQGKQTPHHLATLRQRCSVRPCRELFRLLREDGLFAPAVLVVSLLISAGGVTFEALLYRTLLDLTATLGLPEQRLGAVAMLIGFAAILLVLSLIGTTGFLRLGRGLETRLRMLLLRSVPLLSDRYLASRPVSDMADRSHLIHQLCSYPLLGARLVGNSFTLALTTAGIIWLDPLTAPLAIASAILAVVVPFVAQPILAERDLRVRTHSGALWRFYYDALCGLTPIRTHGAEPAIRSEHEGLLVKWIEAGMRLRRATVVLEGAGSCVNFGLVIWLLLTHVSRFPESAGGLLLAYWALSIPVIGREISETILQYPQQHNIAQRLLEPVDGVKADRDLENTTVEAGNELPGVRIEFANVSVRALGQTILEDIDLKIEPGSHVCVVGPSGAGKSTLAGLLLGWHSASAGVVSVDGSALDSGRLDQIRLETAWVDPSVQVWNRSLLENLCYGSSTDLTSSQIGEIVYAADLLPVLEALPAGLQTPLGESGRLLSGGEAQRVRLGRAMLRSSARLVILDEPFTALDRTRREQLLRQLRTFWAKATLLFITHDVCESRHFDRVIVLAGGRIVEDGVPIELAETEGSHLGQLLEAEETVKRNLLTRGTWRRLWLEDGDLCEAREHYEYEQRFDRDVLARRSSERSFGGTGTSIGSTTEAG